MPTRTPISRLRTCAAAALLSIAAAALAAPAKPRRATPAEAQDAARRLPALFEGRDDMPDGPATARLPTTLYWSRADGGLLLAPALVRFRDAANAYCRLATLSADAKDATLIDVPEDANAPDCRGFRDLRYLDANGDGRLDLVASVTVKSNAFDGDVDVPAVYLSRPERKGGYCYSAATSGQLQAADLRSDDKARRALERARQRLGAAVFKCADEN